MKQISNIKRYRGRKYGKMEDSKENEKKKTLKMAQFSMCTYLPSYTTSHPKRV
jgi:hypothetical protein